MVAQETRNKNMPRHIAIIMDGNGRWAKAKNLPRATGHKAGGDALKRIVHAVGELRIDQFSVYAFSAENWSRPKAEVDALMMLFLQFCKNEVPELIKTNTCLKFIGDVDNMPKKQRVALKKAELDTAHCTGLQFNVCLNYGARQEIIRAVKEIVKAKLAVDQIDEKTISEHLYTKGIPDPDLLIRTSGEQRLSNYFLWQLSYTELCFVDVYWPDFSKEDLIKCIEIYKRRQRRYGGI